MDHDMIDDEFSWNDRPEEAAGGEEGLEAFHKAEAAAQHMQAHGHPRPAPGGGGFDEFTLTNDVSPMIEGEFDDAAGYADEHVDGGGAPYELDNAQRKSLSEVKLKLEQAKLYEMMINFDMFGSVDVHPDAVATVKEEMKFFLMDRLEVLMGQKEDEYGGARNFTALEVKALKHVAEKITDKFKHEDVYAHRDEPEEEDEGHEDAPSGGLRRLGAERKAKAPARERRPVESKPPARQTQDRRPVESKPPAKARPAAKPATPLRRRGQRPPAPKKKIPLVPRRTKPIEEMSEEELRERNRQANNYVQAKSTNDNRRAMPSVQDQFAYYQTQAANPKLQNFLHKIANAKKV